MRIAIASGKGGTGKTTVATGLALAVASLPGSAVMFLDCDVEAPNAHLFLHPALERREEVGFLLPEVGVKICPVRPQRPYARTATDRGGFQEPG
jgi:MinD superfamily P-loop ATPase